MNAISEKTLAETVHYIPKGLRKGNPFHGPFAQLSYIYIIIVIVIVISITTYSHFNNQCYHVIMLQT